MLWSIIRLFKSSFQIIGLGILYPILFIVMMVLNAFPPVLITTYMIFVLSVDIINLAGDAITNFAKLIFGIRKNNN